MSRNDTHAPCVQTSIAHTMAITWTHAKNYRTKHDQSITMRNTQTEARCTRYPQSCGTTLRRGTHTYKEVLEENYAIVNTPICHILALLTSDFTSSPFIGWQESKIRDWVFALYIDSFRFASLWLLVHLGHSPLLRENERRLLCNFVDPSSGIIKYHCVYVGKAL